MVALTASNVEVNRIWLITLIVPNVILGGYINGDSSRPNSEYSESKDKEKYSSSPAAVNQPRQCAAWKYITPADLNRTVF